MNTSFTFLQLGIHCICHELCWFTFACLRSSVINQIKGGWSRCLRVLLKRMLISDLSMSRAGVPMLLHGQAFTLYANSPLALTDLDGIRIAANWMGSNSTRPCTFCDNCWMKGHPLIPGQFDIAEPDFGNFRPRTHEVIVGIQHIMIRAEQEFKDGARTKTNFEALQSNLGYKPNPDGLFCDAELGAQIDFENFFRTDWVHNELQQGVVSREIQGLMKAVGLNGITKDDFNLLMRANWQFPKHLSTNTSNLIELFSSQKSAASDSKSKVRAKASDLLSLYTLLRHMCEKTLAGIGGLERERVSFENCCSVVDLYIEGKRSTDQEITAVAEALGAAQNAHLRSHLEAYGNKYIIPKHHARGHIKKQMLSDSMTLDMFVVERLNWRLKQVSEAVCYTGTFEKSILQSLLTMHCNQLMETVSLLPGLLGRTKSLDGYPNVTLGRGVSVRARAIYTDDIVTCQGETGLVVACVHERTSFYIVVQLMERVGPRTRTSATFVLTNALRPLAVSDCREANAWYKDAIGRYVVLF